MSDTDTGPGPINPELSLWIGEEIQAVAIRHDLAGPRIGTVGREAYREELVAHMRLRVLAAAPALRKGVAARQVERICGCAADELIRIREIHAAHEAGTLPTEAMRQLPLYSVYTGYFENLSALWLPGLADAAGREWHLGPTAPRRKPGREVGPTAGPHRDARGPDREWVKLQILASALYVDFFGDEPPGASPEAQLAKAARRLRERFLRGIEIGDIALPAEEVEAASKSAAREALELRALKAAHKEGRISDAALHKTTGYRDYPDYFHGVEQIAHLVSQLADLFEAEEEPPDSRS